MAIELRYMKLKDAPAEAVPALQWRESWIGGHGETRHSPWQMVPLVFTDTPQSEDGDTHSARYGD